MSATFFTSETPVIDISAGVDLATTYPEDPVFATALAQRYTDMQKFMSTTNVKRMNTQLVQESTGTTFKISISL